MKKLRPCLSLSLACCLALAFPAILCATQPLYVVYGDSKIGVFDARTGEDISVPLISDLETPRQIAVVGDTLYVTLGRPGKVAAYSASSGSLMNDSFISGLNSPSGIEYSGGYLYVTESAGDQGGRIMKFNAGSGELVQADFITGLMDASELVIGGEDLFVVNASAGSVGRYAVLTGATLNAQWLSSLGSPAGCEVRNGRLYISASTGSGSVNIRSVLVPSGLAATPASIATYASAMKVVGSSLLVAQSAHNRIVSYATDSGRAQSSGFSAVVARPSALELGDDDERPQVGDPAIGEVGSTTAQASASVGYDAGYEVTEGGFVYAPTALNPMPARGEAGVTVVRTIGAVTDLEFTLNNLVHGTEYSIRSYAVNSQGVGYSGVANFITESLLPVASLSEPETMEVNPGDRVSLSVSIDGGPVAVVTYRWRRNGQVLPGETRSTFTIAAASQLSEGRYDCQVSNPFGSIITNACVLTVNDPVVIVGQPRTTSARIGSDTVFTVMATGTEPLSYQWRRNGLIIDGANDRTLNISVDESAGGSFDVLVSNMVNSVVSTAASLQIFDPPTIDVMSDPVETQPGGTATFSVSASGRIRDYQWRRNGVDLPGRISSVLTLTNVQQSSEGWYDVVVRGAYGTVISPAVRLSVIRPLSITQQPSSMRVRVGETFSLSVEAVAQSGELSYQWFKDGVAITNAADVNSVSFEVADRAAAGIYTVKVSSGLQSVMSDPATVNVVDSGLLIYSLRLSSTIYSGTSSSRQVVAGSLIVDRFTQTGAILLFGKQGSLNTYESQFFSEGMGLRMDSTGPKANTQSVLSFSWAGDESVGGQRRLFYLRGRDMLSTLSASQSFVAPRLMSGSELVVESDSGTQISLSTLSATLDSSGTLRSRDAEETVSRVLSRVKAELGLKGYVSLDAEP